MVRKLPRCLVDRWSREVDRWLNKDEDQPHSEITSSDVRKGEVSYSPFSVFCRFLQRESRIACNSVTTARLQKEEVVKEDLDKGRKSNGFNRRRPLRFNSLATESHEVTDNKTNSRKEKKSEATSCPLCKAPHDLDRVCNARPSVWFRYVDDTFTLFDNKNTATQFLHYLNNCHTNIKFTVEFEENNTIPFLDILIKRCNHTFSTSIYRKKTFTGLYTKWDSFTPRKYKVTSSAHSLFVVFASVRRRPFYDL